MNRKEYLQKVEENKLLGKKKKEEEYYSRLEKLLGEYSNDIMNLVEIGSKAIENGETYHSFSYDFLKKDIYGFTDGDDILAIQKYVVEALKTKYTFLNIMIWGLCHNRQFDLKWEVEEEHKMTREEYIAIQEKIQKEQNTEPAIQELINSVDNQIYSTVQNYIYVNSPFNENFKDELRKEAVERLNEMYEFLEFSFIEDKEDWKLVWMLKDK